MNAMFIHTHVCIYIYIYIYIYNTQVLRKYFDGEYGLLHLKPCRIERRGSTSDCSVFGSISFCLGRKLMCQI